MARRRRHGDGPASLSELLVLDAEGVAKAAANNASVQVWLERARELDADIVISAVTLAELVRGVQRDASINRVVKTADVWAVDESLARRAGRLLSAARSAATVDALVAATTLDAQERHDGAQCVVLTSDPGDLSALLAGHRGVRVIAV